MNEDIEFYLACWTLAIYIGDFKSAGIYNSKIMELIDAEGSTQV